MQSTILAITTGGTMPAPCTRWVGLPRHLATPPPTSTLYASVAILGCSHCAATTRPAPGVPSHRRAHAAMLRFAKRPALGLVGRLQTTYAKFPKQIAFESSATLAALQIWLLPQSLQADCRNLGLRHRLPSPQIGSATAISHITNETNI